MEQAAVSFDIRRYSRHAEAHSHAHHQIVLPIQGRLDMELCGRGGAVTAAQAAVIATGEQHSFAGSADSSFLIVDVAQDQMSGPQFGRALWDFTAPRPFVALDGPLRGLCAFLAAEVENQGLQGPQSAMAGDMLLGALARRLGLPTDPMEPALARAIAIMRAQLHAPLPLEAVARKAGLSTSRLHALFRSRLGTSPQRYLAGLRMAQAARLLAGSRLPIAEIALSIGYGDQSAFSRAFRREFGKPPAAYRLAVQERETRHKIH